MTAKSSSIDPELYAHAKKSLKKKRDAWQFLVVTIVVNGFLSGLWWFTTPDGYFWPMWVMFGMGIGVLFAFLDAYSILGDRPITDSQIRDEAEKIQNRR